MKKLNWSFWLGLNFGENREKKLLEGAWLLFRVCLALFMLRHGVHKLHSLSEPVIRFADPFGLGMTFSLILVAFAEFFGSLCVLFGFLTRWFSSTIVFTMLVAGLGIHWEDPFSKKELALVYALAFFILMLIGSGKYSVDAYLKRKLKS